MLTFVCVCVWCAGAVAPGDQVVGGVEATDAQPESNLTDKDLPIDEKIAKAEAALKSIGIEYATVRHKPAMTVQLRS